MASLSLILLCGGHGDAGAEAVVRTLSAFVAASVNGLLRDAILAGPAQDELALIAEHAGCAVAEAEEEAAALRRAIDLARGADLFILRAGYVPEIASPEAIGNLATSARSARRGWLLRAPGSAVARVFPRLAPALGFIAPREPCADVQAPSFGNLRKATRARAALHFPLRRVL